MADLFLSYAREDTQAAERIAQALEAEGFDVFWDTEIPPGQTWADFIETKLANSHAVIVLWSEHSTKSQWVREEARMGRDADKLIPVTLDASIPPFGFGEVQSAVLSGWDGDRTSTQWQRVVGAVRNAIEKAGQTPPAPRPAPPPPTGPRGFSQANASPAAALGAGTPAAAPKKGLPKAAWWIIGVCAVLFTLGVIGLMAEEGDPSVTPGPQPAPFADNGGSGGGEVALPAQAGDAQDRARALAQEARAASAQAERDRQSAIQAVTAAQQNQDGFGVYQDGVTTYTGHLARLGEGQPAPIMVQSEGETFLGVVTPHPNGTFSVMSGLSDNGRGYTSMGVTSFDGAQAGRFVGQTRTESWSFEGEGRGRPGGFESNGVGVFNYASGERYEGEYRSAGRDVIVSKNGYGVLYAPNGDVAAAGRFENDRFVGP